VKLLSYEFEGKTGFGALRNGNEVIPLGGVQSPQIRALRDFIERGNPVEASRYVEASSTALALESLRLLPVIPNPSKILCVGLNYEAHVAEAGKQMGQFPTLFIRLADSQVGHMNAITRPDFSHMLDFEGEIAVVIGKGGRNIAEADAMSAVFGYSPYNDASVRDWQRHTGQYTPGKNFDRTGGFGPWVATADEVGDIVQDPLELTTRLNGKVMQNARSSDMNFSIPSVIAYCSRFTTLRAGDVIVTGTPGGVGTRRTPPIYMKAGDVVEVEVSRVGILRNVIVDALPGA